MLAACVLRTLPQTWPCSRATVRGCALLLHVVHLVGLATCQSTQQPIHLLSQQGNGEHQQLQKVQPLCSREWWMPARLCCMDGVSTATRCCMASLMRVAGAMCMQEVLYRVPPHACRGGIGCYF